MQTYVPLCELVAEAMKISFPFSCTPSGSGLPSALVQLTVSAPVPPASQNSLNSSPSLTVTGEGVMAAVAGTKKKKSMSVLLHCCIEIAYREFLVEQNLLHSVR